MSRRVLIVDDDDAIVDMVTAALEDKGYEVLSALGGEAVSLARDEVPDLILLDLQMPIMDGIEMSGRLRSDPRTAGIPIIAMSAQARLSQLGPRMHANDAIPKPFELTRLYAVVAKWATGPTGQRPDIPPAITTVAPAATTTTAAPAATEDVLLVMALRPPVYQAYVRSAELLQTSTPALIRHVLSGVAPVLDGAAAELSHGGNVGQERELYLHTILQRGGQRVGDGSQCRLTRDAMRPHERAMRAVERAQELLAAADVTMRTARVALDRSHNRYDTFRGDGPPTR